MPNSAARHRAFVWFSLSGFALLLGIASLAFGPHDAAAGRIIVLDADTLRTPSEDRRDRDHGRIKITWETDADSIEKRVEWRTDWEADSDGDVVRFGESVIISEDETVEGSVVAIGGNIRVDGTVEEDVVALAGTIHLGPTAVIEGDAVCLGGRFVKDPGAQIYGEDVGLSFTPAGWFQVDEAWGGPIVWLTFLATMFFFLFLSGGVLELFFPLRVRTMADVLRTRVWMSLFAGVAIHVLFGPVLALLTIIIIGIPIAILLPFVYVLISVAGCVVVAGVLGARLLGSDFATRGAWIRSLAAGLFLLLGGIALGEVIAVAGGFFAGFGRALVLLGLGVNWTLGTIGMGAALLSRFGSSRPSMPDEAVIPPLPPPDPFGSSGAARI